MINVLCASVFHLDITVAQEEDITFSLHFREIWIQCQLVVHTLHHGWSALLQEPLQATVIPWCHPTKRRCDYNISNDSYSLAFIRLIIQLVSLSQKTNNIWLLGLAKLSSSSQRDTRRSMICQLLGPFLTNSMHAPSPCHWLLYLS